LGRDAVSFVRWEPGVYVPKPKRGAGILQREKDDAERKAHEDKIAKAVKTRDGHKCRWPEAHKCRGGVLEAAHIEDKSLRGPTCTENEVTLCPWIHRRGPESIHGKELKIEKETDRGADGALSFWRQTGDYDELGQPVYTLVAREVRPFQYERD
jgi:hypothetical protein